MYGEVIIQFGSLDKDYREGLYTRVIPFIIAWLLYTFERAMNLHPMYDQQLPQKTRRIAREKIAYHKSLKSHNGSERKFSRSIVMIS